MTTLASDEKRELYYTLTAILKDGTRQVSQLAEAGVKIIGMMPVDMITGQTQPIFKHRTGFEFTLPELRRQTHKTRDTKDSKVAGEKKVTSVRLLLSIIEMLQLIGEAEGKSINWVINRHLPKALKPLLKKSREAIAERELQSTLTASDEMLKAKSKVVGLLKQVNRHNGQFAASEKYAENKEGVDAIGYHMDMACITAEDYNALGRLINDELMLARDEFRMARAEAMEPSGEEALGKQADKQLQQMKGLTHG